MPNAEVQPATTPQLDLADELRTIVLWLGRHLRREAQQAGLSVIDGQLLGHIYRQPGVGVSELAALERMSRATMSVHVKRLIEARWVSRQQDAPDGDQRRIGLSLTTSGRNALSDIRAEQSRWLMAKISELDAAEITAISNAIGPLTMLLEDYTQVSV